MEQQTIPVETHFVLSNEDKNKVKEWLKEVRKDEVNRKKEWYKENNFEPPEIEKSCWDNGYPYHGAIGGSVTYSFTPTSIGVIVKATYTAFDKEIELNLTDFSTW